MDKIVVILLILSILFDYGVATNKDLLYSKRTRSR